MVSIVKICDEKLEKTLGNFTSIAKKILGDEEFSDVLQYFVDIFIRSSECKQCYINVFITRRCNVLFQIFVKYLQQYIAFAKQFSENKILPYSITDEILNLQLDEVQNNCVTDVNLLSLSKELTSYYKNNEDFPEIFIYDEILIHGRAINSFLLELERRILKEFSSEEQSSVRNCFLKRLNLYVYTQSKDILLLLSRYCDRMYAYKIRERNEWRDLSARFARLISISSVNNISYSWSLAISNNDFLRFNYEFESRYPSFRYYLTGLQRLREDNFIFMYPDDTNVKVIGTVRTKKSLLPYFKKNHVCDGGQLFVPFLMFDNLSIENEFNLYTRIVEDIMQNLGANIVTLFTRSENYFKNVTNCVQEYYNWIVQVNELVLEYLLFDRFLKEVFKVTKEQRKLFVESIDADYIARNYKYINEDDKSFKLKTKNDVVFLLTKLWDWEPEHDLLEKYLDILVKDVDPIWNGALFGNQDFYDVNKNKFFSDDAIVLVVQNAIAKIGFEAEQNAYERFTSNVAFNDNELSQWGKKYSVRDMFLECVDSFKSFIEYYDKPEPSADIYQIVAILIQAMDLGLIGMGPFYGLSCKTNLENKIYTSLKAGEQALFIKPLQLRHFIPVLREIVNKWGNLPDILSNIMRFSKVYVENRYKNCASDFLANSQEVLNRVNEDESKYTLTVSDPKKLFKQLWKFLEDLRKTGQTLDEWNFPLFSFPGVSCPSIRGNGEEDSFNLRMADWEEQIKCLEYYTDL